MFDFRRHATTRPRPHRREGVGGVPGTGVGLVPLRHPGDPRAWVVDRWARLERFLTLGGATHHAGERATARALARALGRADDDVSAVLGCIAADGARVVRRAVDVAAHGHAASDDPALLVLALAADAGDAATRDAAHAALAEVARTAAHLFRWMRWRRALPGWEGGRAARDAVARWYAARTPRELAHQLMRWPARDGWTHADALRLAALAPPSAAHALLFRWALEGWPGVLALRGTVDADLVERIEAAHALREMTPADAARVIAIYRLPLEIVPAPLLRHAAVWEALLDVMPLTTLLRRLGTMTRAGLLAPGSAAARAVAGRLRDHDAVHGARLAPLALVSARRAYTRGRGARAWTPVPEIVDALHVAFVHALGNAPASGRRVLLALDVSAAMAASARGARSLTCREAAAATALAVASSESEPRIVALTAGLGPIELALSPRHRLDAVLGVTAALAGGAADCALPMTVALERGWAVDAFVVLTAHGRGARDGAAARALRAYRQRTGIAARLVIVRMASDGARATDPDDAGMLDVVGFDAGTPRAIADFVRGAPR